MSSSFSPASGTPRRRSTWAGFWLLLALSALLRVAVALPVIRAEVEPAWDEAGYLSQARGYHALLTSRLAAVSSRPEDAEAAYGRGTWPPLHPLVLSLVFLLFGPTVAVARWTSVALAALTTPVVWRLGTRLAGAKAGWAAALIHLVYPGFVGFAHLLWSENLYLLLLLLGLEVCLAAPEAGTGARRLGLAGLGGLVLGLATLTRISGAPLLLVTLLWLAWQGRRRGRWMLAVAGALVAGLTLLPWHLQLHSREGSPVLLSAANGYNLALGQFEQEMGESGPERKVRINRMIRARSEETGEGRDQAARQLALERIREDPPGFVARCLKRLPRLFYGEAHLVRHLYQLVYPPLPPALASMLRVLLLVGYVLLLGLGLEGLIAAGAELRHRGLLVALALAATLPSLPTVASSRIAMPILAVLLPAAGLAAARLWARRASTRRACWLLLGLLALQTYRHWHFERGSAWYGAAQLWWRPSIEAESGEDEGLAGDGPRRHPVGDTLLLRAAVGSCEEVELEAALPGLDLSFGIGPSGAARLVWDPNRRPVVALAVRSLKPEVPSRLKLTCRPAGTSVSFELATERSHWHRWRPAGLPGLESYWWGGSEVRPVPAALLSP